jgi:hypothetical protein
VSRAPAQTAVSRAPAQTAVSRAPVSRAPDRMAVSRAPDRKAVSRAARLKARRAAENGAYVRKLLRQRQPEFAATLAAAEKYVSFR